MHFQTKKESCWLISPNRLWDFGQLIGLFLWRYVVLGLQLEDFFIIFLKVETALSFLTNPRIANRSEQEKREFLDSKGLTEDEILESFRRATISTITATRPQPVSSSYGLSPEQSAFYQLFFLGIRSFVPRPVSTFEREFTICHCCFVLRCALMEKLHQSLPFAGSCEATANCRRNEWKPDEGATQNYPPITQHFRRISREFPPVSHWPPFLNYFRNRFE